MQVTIGESVPGYGKVTSIGQKDTGAVQAAGDVPRWAGNCGQQEEAERAACPGTGVRGDSPSVQ